MTTENKTIEWIDAEYNNLEQQKKEFLASKGIKPALKLEKGVTDVEIDLSFKPEKALINTPQGEKQRMIFHLKSHPENNLMVNPILYGQIVRKLKSSNSGVVHIMRSGDMDKTRYELL